MRSNGRLRWYSVTTAFHRSRMASYTAGTDYEQKILDLLKPTQKTSESTRKEPSDIKAINLENDGTSQSSLNTQKRIFNLEKVLDVSKGKSDSVSTRSEATGMLSTEMSKGSRLSDGTPVRTLGEASRERRVPSSPIGRVVGFAGLGVNLAYGAVQGSLTSLFGSGSSKTGMMNERNAEVLAAGLCRMRGAALKLGQMLSIQDEAIIPTYLQTALDRLRAGADYMPRHQLEHVMRTELGPQWIKKFQEFDFMPMAAASIGQVHRAVLLDGTTVAMKIQYPGVATSIESDLNNLMTLMKMTDMLPEGLYIDAMVKVMRKELALECNYQNEIQSQIKFKNLVEADSYCCDRFRVPLVFPDLSTGQILTSEWVEGIPIDKVKECSQSIRNEVGERLLHMTMKELFTWKFMQTDPNWGNFLFDTENEILNLIDFGASREYPSAFTDTYLKMVTACAERNRAAAIECSKQLGFLTGKTTVIPESGLLLVGDESQTMLDAHCEAGFIVGRPFSEDGDYDFRTHSQYTARVAELGSIMLKHRLCPPPEEAYSLHRKLSGAFLCCIKLESVLPSHRIFYDVVRNHNYQM